MEIFYCQSDHISNVLKARYEWHTTERLFFIDLLWIKRREIPHLWGTRGVKTHTFNLGLEHWRHNFTMAMPFDGWPFKDMEGSGFCSFPPCSCLVSKSIPSLELESIFGDSRIYWRSAKKSSLVDWGPPGFLLPSVSHSNKFQKGGIELLHKVICCLANSWVVSPRLYQMMFPI